jgi:hypothetical protein
VSQLVLVDSAGYPPDGGSSDAHAARTPALIGDIGIYFKPEVWVWETLLEAYADRSMVTNERVKRTAELQRSPATARPPSSAPALRAARSDPDQTAPETPGLFSRPHTGEFRRI